MMSAQYIWGEKNKNEQIGIINIKYKADKVDIILLCSYDI